VTTFAVLNKADRLGEEALAEATEFTRRVLGQAAASSRADGGRSAAAARAASSGSSHPSGDPGQAARVYPVSASAARAGGDAGFAEFSADFRAYLTARRTADLNVSAIAQARRIARSLQDEVGLSRRVAQIRAADAAGRAEQFAARLAEVPVRSRDALTTVQAEAARLLFALNDSADEAAPRLSSAVARQLEAVLDGELRAAQPDAIDCQGRERLVALTRETVGAWREQRAAEIEIGLARVDARLAADLWSGLDVLSRSAAELLGLDLSVPELGARLTGEQRLFRTVAGETGQTEPPASVVQRRLPRGPGRRRVRERLRREAPALVAAELGKVRAELGERLAGATRTLAQVTEQRYTDGAERMEAGLQAAANLRESSAADARRTEEELARREVALRHALGLLDQAAGPARKPSASSTCCAPGPVGHNR
jgi:hypothetical protein